MTAKLANNAVSKLATGIATTDTTITVLPGEGAKFPAVSGTDWFPATLVKSTGEYEIIKCTARSSDSLTVTRAQEGTSALSFLAGDRIELRMTAAVHTETQQSILDLFPTGFGPLPWSRVSPPSGWIFADGRILLPDTTYPTLRTAYILDGFPYGQDGLGNPRIPDACGRVIAGRDNMSGAAAGRLTAATALGVALGAETHTLTTAQIPAHNHGITDPGHAHGASQANHTHTIDGLAMGRVAAGYGLQSGSSNFENRLSTYPTGSTTNTGSTSGASDNTVTVNSALTGITTQNAGTGGAHNNVQPTLVMNFIVKV